MAVELSLKRCKEIADSRDPALEQYKEWCYNALDAAGTREIADTLLPRLTPETALTYNFERALQAPAFAMMNRGVLVDTVWRNRLAQQVKMERDIAVRAFRKMPEVKEVWDLTELETGWCKVEPDKHHKWPRGVPDSPERRCERCGTSRVKIKPFNPDSPEQVKHLFYDLLGVAPMYNKKKEIGVDDDILDRIGIKYPHLFKITEAIRNIRDLTKQHGALTAKLTPDNRYPSSFNVGAAWTGRFSSSQNPDRLGGNLQNVAERHRRAFIADPGFWLGYADLKTAESQVVAYLAGDEAYIEAHKGDVHTYVTRLLWPDLGWTGDIKKDKGIAKSKTPEWDNVPGHDYRFQSKRIQHGSNYLLSPFGIAIIAHIPVKAATFAQDNYFDAFPYIRGWHNHTSKDIREHKPLTNPLGRQVTLFGRPWDKHTIRQGVSFKPQSAVADILDLAMWRVWWHMDPAEVQILAQVHDAILFQFPAGRLDIVRKMADLMRIPVDIMDYRGNKRRMTIQVEVAVGRNWGHKCISVPGKKPCSGGDNPGGLEEVEV